ncbi:hypothetical protein GCM10009839_55350 [Catenulispora yoronensis]|uniref:DUF1648 domain-containing protein n=1 Tax=Catenulispora yoronensis TaxID=450799 RepID=A0ABP5GDL0_9ACTN
MGDDDTGIEMAGMLVGAVLMAISLPLAFISFHYAPPGGSGVVDGHKIQAFTETISTWRFAHVATWSHILPFFLFVFIRLAAMLAEADAARIGGGVLHAILHITFLVGCVLFIGLAVQFGHTTMPSNGQQGLLPALHGSPYKVSTGEVQSTPYLTSSLGLGWWLMTAGILIGALSMWRTLLVSLGALIAALIVFGIVDLIFHTGIDSGILRWIDRL